MWESLVGCWGSGVQFAPFVYQLISVVYRCFFFFQAEDGIRYLTVTGVQTCALPILIEQILPQLRTVKTVIPLSGSHPEWEISLAWRDRQDATDPHLPIAADDVALQ